MDAVTPDVGRALEATLQIVCPGVIRAANALFYRPGLADQNMSPMPTDIVKNPQSQIFAPNQKQGELHERDRLYVSCVWRITGEPDTRPHGSKYAFALLYKFLSRDVEIVTKRSH